MAKSKYTPFRVKKILHAVSLGASRVHAALYGGISEATFYAWCKEYPDFLEAIKEAEGAATARWLGHIEKAAQTGSWQASAWKLERIYPALYGRRIIDHHHTVDVKAVAEEMAQELGLSVEDVLAEAERILSETPA